jgi:hypothetical protein
MTSQINGALQCGIGDEWYNVVEIGVLLLANADVNDCLFGVDNHAGFVPLFPDRGLPPGTVNDLGIDDDQVFGASFASFEELSAIDWDELATTNDGRIHEWRIDGAGTEVWQTKFLDQAGLEAVREKLAREPDATVRQGDAVYRRPVIRRRDAIDGTNFHLLMDLLGCLAGRFGRENARLVAWF